MPVGDEAGAPVAPIEERVETIPRRSRWLDEVNDDDFCHVAESGVILCGSAGSTPLGPAPCCYSKAAICPTCGLPRCPRCAVLDSLAERLEA